MLSEKQRKSKHEERDEKRLRAVYDLADINPRGFPLKVLFSEYPELFTNKTQVMRYLIKLRDEKEVMRYERIGHNYLYFRKDTTYKLLNELWLKQA